jgi:NADPH:quinone reductase-like Zn-dependent oxidoreductase
MLGSGLAGEIESVDKVGKLLNKGDQVFGSTTGLSSGSYADYICQGQRFVGRQKEITTRHSPEKIHPHHQNPII